MLSCESLSELTKRTVLLWCRLQSWYLCLLLQFYIVCYRYNIQPGKGEMDPVSSSVVIYGRGVARKLPPSVYVDPAPSSASRRSLVNVFGTPRARTWKIPTDGTAVGLAAAQLQHSVARQFRDAIAVSEWGSLAEFARQHDQVSYDRLRGILSGDMWIRLEDVAELSDVLGLDVQVILKQRDPETGDS